MASTVPVLPWKCRIGVDNEVLEEVDSSGPGTVVHVLGREGSTGLVGTGSVHRQTGHTLDKSGYLRSLEYILGKHSSSFNYASAWPVNFS